MTFPLKNFTLVHHYSIHQKKMHILDLVGGIDIGTDGRAGGLQNIRGAERGGGHDATSLKPSVLLQSRELQPSLRIYR